MFYLIPESSEAASNLQREYFNWEKIATQDFFSALMEVHLFCPDSSSRLNTCVDLANEEMGAATLLSQGFKANIWGAKV